MSKYYIPSYAKLREHILNAPHAFAVLGVHRGSSMRAIDEARRSLARHLHPDINNATDAQDLMARVNVAHHALTIERERYLNTLSDRRCATCGGRGYTTKQLSFTRAQETICTPCQGSGTV